MKINKKDYDENKDSAYVDNNVPTHIKNDPKFKHLKLDRCLNIIIDGTPIADSRPRFNRFTGAVATVNLSKIVKRFRSIYEKFPVLQELTILSPFLIDIAFFMPCTKKDLTFLKERKEMNFLETETYFDISIKDVDNMLKIHNDLLFVDQYRITLEDGWNVGFLTPLKFISKEPRTVMKVYYSSKPEANPYYYKKITESASFFRYLISKKAYINSNRNREQQIKTWRKLVLNHLGDSKSDKEVRAKLSSFCSVLEEYRSCDLKYLSGLSQVKDDNTRTFNKDDAIIKILCAVLDGTRYYKVIDEKLKDNNFLQGLG